MNQRQALMDVLARIDGRSYKAYKELQGKRYDFGDFLLCLDHVQGDPFAAPSRLSAQLPYRVAGIPSEWYSTPLRRRALADFLTRCFAQGIRRLVKGRRGSGHSGTFQIDQPGQEVLERNSIVFLPEALEVRFTVGLPAAGRRVLGRQAMEMLTTELPRLVDLLRYRQLDQVRLAAHVHSVEDQQALREQLQERGLVAFLADGSLLPRRSGVDERPLESTPKEPVVPFHSPAELAVALETPHSGRIQGMGIPRGVTLIVGGGFHGKSTLLRALERGVYDHIPGDGREKVVTLPTAVKIRAEDGRFVEKVDISPFINNLPFGRDTRAFQTQNASGSTSQAANIMEALEMGSQLLLIDEDTSATNFIIRDARMQALVSKEKEPITPFLDKVRQLFQEYGVSTVLVMGGSGDYFEAADRVILMDHYRPRDVTPQAREIVQRYPTRRRPEGGSAFGPIPSRRPLPSSFDASRGRREVKIDTKSLKTILYGRTPLDLSALEQLVDISQTRAIGEAIHRFAQLQAREGRSLREGLQLLEQELEEKGLDALLPYKAGNLARPRLLEIAFAINRMRTLQVEE